MFQKVLVANRGEIAVAIIRSLRELNIKSVAIYSEADRYALHTELADEAICVGPAKGLDSYANPVAVLSAAIVSGADAIHPGYGFLSERSDFVSLCEETNIKFIGPTSEVIEKMGNKQNARTTMKEADVPIVPGTKKLVENIQEANQIAKKIGYPLMIKAADGGGGKGMRLALNPEELEYKFQQAQNETQSIYGNQDLYIERVIYPAKHIEVQILADEEGNVIHLGERDCSLQRNNQKVIEFAPSLTLSKSVRERMWAAAVKAAKAIGYTNAGTIEFLVDQDENFYFMEMNTRLQVEHPITEMITGVDIIKSQIEIASGLKLKWNQSDIKIKGFAIECRLNAEDPTQDFQPAAGHIERLILPNGGLGLRVEAAVYSDYTLSPFYDSMLAKIITHQPTKEEAFKKMNRALYEVSVAGIQTNIDLLESLINKEEVKKETVHVKWLEEEFMPDWLDKFIKEEKNNE
ncbi:MAG: acetyl-CoA carboxylase biotin carboxylase subunit [Atopostipes suicloacalis]|nr:acetyl-CoA carboxylase biotin carboxylase subunit [Atopostipes suicloacalis]MDN6731018.1 acetyl-CoA carboxylase biotin carboxylase subunit [Atopostipes suicloacalis]